LSLYAYKHGIGPHTEDANATAVDVPFPGNTAGANSLFNPVSAKTIGRFMIYASQHPKICGGRLFNISDNETPCTYGELWPHLANWFGLVGVVPVDSPKAQENMLGVGELPRAASFLTPGEYVAQNRDTFAQCGLGNAVTGGVGAGSSQLDSVGYWLTFDRQMSLKRLRGTGFEGDMDPVQGWLDSFEMFRKAGLVL